MLMILVDGAILKGLVVDAIDDWNCHRGVVPAGRRRKSLSCIGSKNMIQLCSPVNGCKQWREPVLVDLAVRVQEHHHHALRLLRPPRSRPWANHQDDEEEDRDLL